MQLKVIVVTAIGLEADPADAVFGSGTKFKTELKIGDQITFTDDANKQLQEW